MDQNASGRAEHEALQGKCRPSVISWDEIERIADRAAYLGDRVDAELRCLASAQPEEPVRRHG